MAEDIGIHGGSQKQKRVCLGNLQGCLCHALAVYHLPEQGNQRTDRNIALLAQRNLAGRILDIFQSVLLFTSGTLVLIDGSVEVDHVLAASSARNIIDVGDVRFSQGPPGPGRKLSAPGSGPVTLCGKM